MKYVLFFDEITQKDMPRVGGKNASLGEIMLALSRRQVRIPMGFAVTTEAYTRHLEANELVAPLKKILAPLGKNPTIEVLQKAGEAARDLIVSVPLPTDVAEEIVTAYTKLSRMYDNHEWLGVAVRSSATAEDLPTASFAGQQETYLYIEGPDALLQACVHGMASLFTDRALTYRREKGFDDFAVAISLGIQKMVRADEGASGVIFTLDPDSGARDFVAIEAIYGLGEALVQGLVNPDEYLVHKTTFAKGFKGVVRSLCGTKNQKLIHREQTLIAYERFQDSLFFTGEERIGSLPLLATALSRMPEEGLELVPVLPEDQQRFVLQSEEIHELTRMALAIEEHYSELKGSWMPMDIEWARDGRDGKLYILQARPETVYHGQKMPVFVRTSFVTPPPADAIAVRGRSVGSGIVSGTARLVTSIAEAEHFHPGDILVTDMTDPDWLPLMRKARALVTNRGGRTCHAAIVSRELGIPALVGTGNATELIAEGERITVECIPGSDGTVYRGSFAATRVELPLDSAKKSEDYRLYVNVSNPDEALIASQLPVDGVGLARLEFIVSSSLGIHPMACAQPEKMLDTTMHEAIAKRLGKDETLWGIKYTERLAQDIACIAAAFYPRPVLVRCTDFKSNEYRNLLGGSFFEPVEENPMLGFRGAARYIHESYLPAFALECRALMRARTVWGLDNIAILIPFVRSVHEARAVVSFLEAQGLRRGENGLQFYMMVEIPMNVLLLEHFAPFFDGFSIGSNDLTQLTLGVDRDSGLVSNLFDEHNAAVDELLHMALQKAHTVGKKIGICGQAPSDYPDIAEALIANGIDSLSLIPEAAVAFLVGQKQG